MPAALYLNAAQRALNFRELSMRVKAEVRFPHPQFGRYRQFVREQARVRCAGYHSGHTKGEAHMARQPLVQPPARIPLSDDTLQHLRASGLNDDTIIQAQITDSTTPVTQQLLESHKVVRGYHIPYFGLDGKRADHYRIRVLENGSSARTDEQRYIQPRNSGNRVYIPPLFADYDWITDTSVRIFLTEGEKKALAASQMGVVTLGLGGVYSWRSNGFRLPRSAVKIEDGPKTKSVWVDAEEAKSIVDRVAPEMTKIEWKGRLVYLAFDSDFETNPKVRQAAYDLCTYLEAQGAQARVLEFWKPRKS